MSLIKRAEGLEFAHNHVGGVIDRNEIARFSAIDAVQVIRCADCAYYGKSPFGHPRIGWCRIDCKHRKPEFFCANADRRAKHEI